MSWYASLNISYSHQEGVTRAQHEHKGPLRILKSLYPEGAGICHNVLIHPPSGLVGGDTLDIRIQVQDKAHALITTPGATRFYRSQALLAQQNVNATLRGESRLEWVPLEALAYDGCRALNQCVFDLKDASEMIAWDITALGMPSADLPFKSGDFTQHFEIKDRWLDRGLIRGDDRDLLQSPLGLNGRKSISTLVFASALAMTSSRRDQLLEIARSVIATKCAEGQSSKTIPGYLEMQVGATSPNAHVIVVRMLSGLVEPSMHLCRNIWLAWRSNIWGLKKVKPRIWSM